MLLDEDLHRRTRSLLSWVSREQRDLGIVGTAERVRRLSHLATRRKGEPPRSRERGRARATRNGCHGSSRGVNVPGYSGYRSAQHQREIDQFAFTPATKPAENLFAQTRVGNESVVKLAPAGVSFSVVAGCPSAVRHCRQPATIKIHYF